MAGEHVELIEVRVRSLEQLFNSIDPSPFVERDLDADAEEFIVEWAMDSPGATRFRLVVHLDQSVEGAHAATESGDGIRNYFRYRAEVMRRSFSRLMREGRLSLLVGLLFLTLCLVASESLAPLSAHPLAKLTGESLIIGGWVAMWRPLEILLYGWWPLLRRWRMLERLARMQVEFRSSARAANPQTTGAGR